MTAANDEMVSNWVMISENAPRNCENAMADWVTTPNSTSPRMYSGATSKKAAAHVEKVQPDPKRELVGVDVQVFWPNRSPEPLSERAKCGNGDGMTLTMIDNRGVKVWPDGMAETFCTDSFRCRFTADNGSAVTQAQVLGVLQRVVGAGLEIVQTVGLQSFDGKSGFTLAQGQ